MILFVISIVLLLFSAAVTGVALSNNVKGAGIGLIPGLVGLLLLCRSVHSSATRD